MTYIEIQEYGDFDMRYTKCIMVSKTKENIKILTKRFYTSLGYNSTSGIPEKDLSGITELFIEYLEDLGFEKLKTKIVCFSD